ncbi:Ketose-bisphosphate aldolase, class-II [Moorella glycerini]|uniref:D-tagatose-1,6-bisphosphate aldolase subunit KbaY n=1 Tax=Neomoorella stamsii TaxID=1266720 RepID=A0A9X7P7J1_9FIRM|nr:MULTISPECIES: class II fructose-bisphosphate aldolase [Moorella]PRR77553.1 D-tagatose-1,6-bisphosphate aldolase subunit KbaY [Moorella stamsii]CEP69400.1 Ketose-bisphosphate aldolase, class-II [Moorella glycerini]
MLTPATELLDRAQRGNYAIAAFNFHNLEILQAIIETAEAEKAPIILQITPAYLEKIGATAAAAMAREAAVAARVPVALHLDHSDSFKWIVWALAHGFTSVMIDASKLPLAENIALSRQVAEAAHATGATAEAELGHIGGVEDSVDRGSAGTGLADPDEAARLVQESGIDALAPALGTAHGLYTSEPKIDFERLDKIRELTPVPLVLHGGSGIPDTMIREAISRGIAKVNIGTELKVAWAEAMQAALTTGEKEPWKAAIKAREAVREVVKHKIHLCGCAGKA